MRIDTNAINVALSHEQREYARTQLWNATRVAAGRVAWAGLWLTAPESAGEAPGIECRITAWLRGTGPMSVLQNAQDALVAIDLAASRLEHALRRRLFGNHARRRARGARQAGMKARRGRAMTALPVTRARAAAKLSQSHAISGLFSGKAGDNVLKYTNGFNPDRDPIPQGGSLTTPAEFFLDFDPVCPGWPPGQQDPPPADSDAFRSAGAEAAVITIDDFWRLKAVIRKARMKWCLRGYPNDLERKLRRARIVRPSDVPADVVTMNSMVRIFDAMSGTHAPLTVVYPHRAASDHDSVSVLSPLGTAILGHRAGQTAGPRVDQSSRRFAIEKVLYQPEAAGDLHL